MWANAFNLWANLPIVLLFMARGSETIPDLPVTNPDFSEEGGEDRLGTRLGNYVLQEVIGRAAERTGNKKYFYNSEQAMDDDHLPFKDINVPVVDLIDFTYGFNNLYHHTTEDKMDKISANSLQVVGDTVLESIRALNTK